MHWALPLSRIIAGIALTALFLLPYKSDAKVWKNSYIEFDLPSGWNCYLENTAWICRHTISKKCLGGKSNSADCKNQRKRTREAIIILAAKERGPQDNVAAYVKHLKTPRPLVTKKGKRTQSKVIHLKPKVKINGQPWVDGQHLSSEIPSYYTRYTAS